MKSIFPIGIFGVTFLSVTELQAFLNKIWFVQILICLCCCIKYKRYWPEYNKKYDAFIMQIYSYLFLSSVLYIIETFEEQLLFTSFDLFLHHIFAIMLFHVTYLKPHIISVCFLTPFLIHSLCWIPGFNTDFVLIIYNISVLIVSVIMMNKSYNKHVKVYSLRALILCGLLYNTNIYSGYYGYNVEILNLDIEKCFKSLAVSLITSVPYYSYLVYVNIDLINIKILYFKKTEYKWI